MIAIIGAFKEEIEGLNKILENKKTDALFDNITSGIIYGKNVVLCVCGIGKVYAAAAAAYILSKYNISEIINIGVAGGVGPDVKKLDVVVADKTVQHDFDLTAVGLKKGQLFEEHNGCFDCDLVISDRLYKLAQKSANAFKGVIATGDKFVASAQESLLLNQDFNALACDMESAAIAQTAQIHKVKFASMRSVSDGADGSAVSDFDVFAKRAAETSIDILSRYLKESEQPIL